VNGTWAEKTITYSLQPALGATIAASVAAHYDEQIGLRGSGHHTAVVDWLNGTANDGIALVANSPWWRPLTVKKPTTTSHPAELDIVFAGGGTITGVTTASAAD